MADHLLVLATFLLVFVTAVGAWVSLRGIRDQLWLLTFAEYTKRYSAIVDNLPPEARNPASHLSLEEVAPAEQARLLQIYRSYLNLCSEELYLHDRKMLDRLTWEIWRTGIRDAARSGVFRQAWARLKGEYSYYPDFCGFIDRIVAEEAKR